MTVTVEEPAATPAPVNDDGLTHLTCECDTDIALCGTPLAGVPWVESLGADGCIVCEHMDFEQCPRCGEW